MEFNDRRERGVRAQGALAERPGAAYITGMSNAFIFLLALAMLAVLASLALGLVAMVKGGDFNARHGNKLMRLRVGFQGLALLLFVVGMMMGRG